MPSRLFRPEEQGRLRWRKRSPATCLGDGDAVFAPAKKPAGATDAQWAQAMPTMERFAQFTLGYIGIEERTPPRLKRN